MQFGFKELHCLSGFVIRALGDVGFKIQISGIQIANPNEQVLNSKEQAKQFYSIFILYFYSIILQAPYSHLSSVQLQ